MAAESATVYLCTSVTREGVCQTLEPFDLALIPAADVPTINQFLSVLGDSIYNPTPEAVLYVFTWGAGAVLSMWSLGIAVGIAKKLIQRI